MSEQVPPADLDVAEVAEVVTSGSSPAGMVAGGPSAVLLLDLDAGQVVYANDLARAFAPDVVLPVDAATWSRRATLLDADGRPLENTATPLARVAGGQPVDGELVTAVRGSGAREKLWAVGTPLLDAPEPLGRRALVVFLPLRDSSSRRHDRDGVADLRHRAVLASDASFAISDPTQPDNPLVWVNPAFERMTGYPSAEVIGRNCRFLQGPSTDRAAVQRIRSGLQNGTTTSETLLNYRADGTAFWNHLVVSPVFDADGNLSHHVGVQTDVSERVGADAARDAALAMAESAIARQRVIAAVSAGLTEQTTRPDQFAERVSGLVAFHLQAATAVALLSEQGQLAHLCAADGSHAEFVNGSNSSPLANAFTDYLAEVGAELMADTRNPSARWPVLLPAPGPDPATEPIAGAQRGILAAPMRIRGRVAGLLLAAPTDARLEDPDEISALTDIAMRAATALDNARLYATERDTALTLQRSLLPTLPTIARFDIAAAYVPAAEAEVGGDWFDVLELPGPWVGVTVGDVVGHDIAAAATMGQLRSMVRMLAWEGHRPRDLIRKLDSLVRTVGTTTLATMLYAIVDNPATDAPDEVCGVTYASAGHPPALLRASDGTVDWLDAATTSPIGVEDSRPIVEATVNMPTGGTLILYTDGLVERRGQDLEHGLSALAAVVERAPADASAGALRDLIVEDLIDAKHADDTCLLVIRRRR